MVTYLKKFIIVAIITLIIALSTKKVFAARGIVVYIEPGCDCFIVETFSGYALLEWYGGGIPHKGDIVVGNFESYGFKNIYNLTTKRGIRVWVKDYWLSEEDAIEMYLDCCP